MDEKILELGERRRVTLEVWMSDGASFDPTNCQWQLLSGTTPEDQGDCQVEEGGKGWRLTCEIQPLRRTSYHLQYSFNMGSEIVKRTVAIKVV